jgi:antibiotic biosynthesis monooxygenase (ABM) superfamily enzyme
MAEPITVSITRIVEPQFALQVSAWERAGQDLLAAAPGYLGAGIMRNPADPREWHMLYRFADAESLAAWENSPERAWWVAGAVNLMADSRQERRTGIEGWFDEPSSVEVISAAPVVPPRWKQMVSIFLVFFPLSLLANWALLPLIGTWPLVLRVLTTVLLMTPLMTYVLMPAVTRALRPWLTRRR